MKLPAYHLYCNKKLPLFLLTNTVWASTVCRIIHIEAHHLLRPRRAKQGSDLVVLGVIEGRHAEHVLHSKMFRRPVRGDELTDDGRLPEHGSKYQSVPCGHAVIVELWSIRMVEREVGRGGGGMMEEGEQERNKSEHCTWCALPHNTSIYCLVRVSTLPPIQTHTQDTRTWYRTSMPVSRSSRTLAMSGSCHVSWISFSSAAPESSNIMHSARAFLDA